MFASEPTVNGGSSSILHRPKQYSEIALPCDASPKALSKPIEFVTDRANFT